jgi:DNA-binding IscR family transcriptional regulator
VGYTVTNWTFLTNHGRVLLCIARNPEVRLRDIAASVEITERRAHGIVADLVNAGYVVKTKDGRRNNYEILDHLPIPEINDRVQAIGDVLDLLAESKKPRRSPKRPAAGAARKPPARR